MPIPPTRLDLRKNRNVRWLRRNIKQSWQQSGRALELLKKCDITEPQCGSINPVWQETLRQSYAEGDAFQEKYMKEKGLEITTNNEPGTPPKVYTVKLNFTNDEWVDLMNTEGEFLPACCATISHVRDVLIGTLREGGFIRATDLFEIVNSLKGHHDCDPEGSDPEARLIQTWEAIEADADLHLIGFPLDPNELDDAFSTLYHSAATLSWNFLTNGEDREDAKFNHDIVRQYEFARILPAIRTIYKTLTESKIEPIEGFAIVEGQKVLQLTGGLAIFQRQEHAEELAQKFNKKAEAEHKNEKDRRLERKYREKAYGKQEPLRPITIHQYSVRKVRVSLENGVELL